MTSPVDMPSWALCILEAVDSLLLAWPQVTAPMAPHWGDLRVKYVEPLLRGLERLATDPAGPAAELALVCFGAATPFSACPLDCAGWTSDVALFRRWLDAVVPAGGGRQQTVLTGSPYYAGAAGTVVLFVVAAYCTSLDKAGSSMPCYVFSSCFEGCKYSVVWSMYLKSVSQRSGQGYAKTQHTHEKALAGCGRGAG